MSQHKMSNTEVAGIFRLLAEVMELHNENPYKIRSYLNAARQIEMLDKDLNEMTPEEIDAIPGVGEAISKKIQVILKTGSLPLLENYMQQTPAGIIELLQIKGLGGKKAGILWKKLGITTVDDLLKAAQEHKISQLKGFGPKTEANIAKAVEYYLSVKNKKLYAEVDDPCEELMTLLSKCKDVRRVQETGEMRRKKPVIERIEILVSSENGTLDSITESADFHWVKKDKKSGLASTSWSDSVYLRACTESDEAMALFLTSTPKEIQEKIRFDPHHSYLNERDIFKAAGIPFIIPEMREPKLDFEYILSVREEEIVRPEDVRGVIHAHSTYSDGTRSIEDMAIEAKARGYEYLVITDHSQSAFYANGMSPETVKKQQKEIEQLNDKMAPFVIFKGIESDILYDGSLDYNDEILSSFDLVIASIHSQLNMSREKATERLLRAIENPFIDILGHMTGRLLLRRDGYPVNHRAIIDACAKEDVIIEINANPHRLDMDWQYIPYAMEKGLTLSIDPDAHSAHGIDDIRYGVYAARKGGLPTKRNLSSLSLIEFKKWLDVRKKKKGMKA